MNCPLASFTDEKIQSVSRPVKCFAVRRVCKSFHRNWRIYIYSVDRITSVKNNQLCFDPNIKMFMKANEFIICCVRSVSVGKMSHAT